MTEEAYLNRGATKTATQEPVKVRSSLSRGRVLAKAQATDLAYATVQQLRHLAKKQTYAPTAATRHVH